MEIAEAEKLNIKKHVVLHFAPVININLEKISEEDRSAIFNLSTDIMQMCMQMQRTAEEFSKK